MEPLDAEQIENVLSSTLDGWRHENNKLIKSFTFSDFRDALSFIVRIGVEAEVKGHHPEIENVYNRVTIALCTHDADSQVTGKDLELAEAIEAVYKKN